MAASPTGAQTPSDDGGGLTTGEVVAGVLLGAAMVGAIVLLVAFSGAIPAIALILSTATADVAAGTVVEAGALVTVEITDTAVAAGETAAATNDCFEGGCRRNCDRNRDGGCHHHGQYSGRNHQSSGDRCRSHYPF